VDYTLTAEAPAGAYTLCEYLPILPAAAQAVQVLSAAPYRLTAGALTMALTKAAGEEVRGSLEYLLPASGISQAVHPPTLLLTPEGRLYTGFRTETLQIEQ